MDNNLLVNIHLSESLEDFSANHGLQVHQDVKALQKNPIENKIEYRIAIKNRNY